MRYIGKISVIALCCWDVVYNVSEAIACVLHARGLLSLEYAVAIIPACILAALAIADVALAKRKTPLNYGREVFLAPTLRPRFD